MKKDVQYTIYDSFAYLDDEFMDSLRESLAETDPDYTVDDLWNYYNDYATMSYEDVLINCDIETEGQIITIADLGLWNGRHSGYRLLDERNIRACLSSEYDPKWYVDYNGDLRCEDRHHDGTNCYLYRELRTNLSDQQIDNFLSKIYNGTVTRKDITRYTIRLGDRIAKVYGWKIRK